MPEDLQSLPPPPVSVSPPPAPDQEEEMTPLVAPQKSDSGSAMTSLPPPPLLQKTVKSVSGQTLPPPLAAAQADVSTRKGLVDERTGLQMDQAAETNKAIAERNEFLKNDTQNYENATGDFKNQSDAEYQKVQAAIAEANSKQKLDPKREWNNLSTGNKIARVIASALGAFGSSITHAPNYAQQSIDKHIQDDIDAQKDEYERAKDKVAIAGNDYAHFRNQKMSDLQSKLAARQLRLDDYKNSIDGVTSRYQVPLIKNAGDAIKDELDHQQTSTMINQYLASQPKSETQSEYAQPKPKSLDDQIKLQGLQVIDPDTGKVGLVTVGNEKDAENLRTYSTALRSLKENSQKMKELLGGHKIGGPMWGSKDAAELAALNKMRTNIIKEFEGTGIRLNPNDAGYLNPLENPEALFSKPGNSLKVLDDQDSAFVRGFSHSTDQHRVVF